jgi:glycosyltransferase involved in cell wall biosynthesis
METKSKKILFLCLDLDYTDNLGDIHSGAGNLYVGECLQILKDKNIRTLVIIRNNSTEKASEEQDGSITIRRICIGEIEKRNKEFLWERQQESIIKIEKVIEELQFKPDVIHAFYWYSGVVGCYLKEKNPTIKLLYSIISLGKVKHAWQGTLSSHDEAREYWETKIFEFSNHILSVSQQEMENVVSLYGITSEKITVIGRGVDVNLFKPCNYLFGQKALIFAGRLVESKGYIWLLKLYETLLQELPICPPLWIFGGDAKEIGVAQQKCLSGTVLQEAYHTGRIYWWGKVSRNILPIFYNRAVLTLVPSYYEPGARVILESMACGTPVIMTPTGYAGELVEDGSNGYVTSMENHDQWISRIKTYLENPLLQNEISLNAYKSFLKRFTMSQFDERQWAVYQKMLND